MDKLKILIPIVVLIVVIAFFKAVILGVILGILGTISYFSWTGSQLNWRKK